MKNKKKICFFFNHERGLNVVKYFSKINTYEIKNIYLSKKNLNKKILPLIKKLNLNYNIIKKVNSYKIISFIKKNKVDINIICAFPYFFKKDLLNSAKFGTLNMHGGKLPNYKGASTLNWQIINGEKKIGISIIKANTSIDGGDILSQYSFNLKDNHEISDVHKIVNKKFPVILENTLKRYFKGKIKLKKNSGGKIYKQRSEKDGKINWHLMNSLEVYNFVRAITKPYPGAFSYIYNTKKKVVIYKCAKSKLKPKIPPGYVFKIGGKTFVKCFKQSVEIINCSTKLKDRNLLI